MTQNSPTTTTSSNVVSATTTVGIVLCTTQLFIDRFGGILLVLALAGVERRNSANTNSTFALANFVRDRLR